LADLEAGRADTDAEVDWVEQLAAGWPMLRAVVAHVPLERAARRVYRIG